MSVSPTQQHLCKVTLLGNLVAKPNIRYSANPVTAIAEINLATHSRWYDKKSQQYKEWTHFHIVKIIGDIVDKTLLFADKGDVVLIHGHMLNSRTSNREIIHANFAQLFTKGYAQSINLVQLSGELTKPINLMTTEQGKVFAEGHLTIHHHVYSPVNKQMHQITIERPFHVWGKQAEYIHQHAKLNDNIVVEGKLSYMNNANKTQFIEAQQTILLNAPKK